MTTPEITHAEHRGTTLSYAAGPVSCQTLIDDDLKRRTTTVGRVHPHVEVNIVDPDTGAAVPRGTRGEFCTRGYTVMTGYWSDDDKTRKAIDPDGWMHTGDLAVMRDDGYCQIVGRIKDMVIRGGENVYPREVEEFLHTHPDVEDVQVVGVPDEKYGEEICAWIKMRPGPPPLDADLVREYCISELAHYKIPRYVRVVDEFPMTVTGKVRKVECGPRWSVDSSFDTPVPKPGSGTASGSEACANADRAGACQFGAAITRISKYLVSEGHAHDQSDSALHQRQAVHRTVDAHRRRLQSQHR